MQDFSRAIPILELQSTVDNTQPKMTVNDHAKEWIVNNKYHRTDGPALEQFDGTKAWYINGKYHRVDGPAVEWHDGYKEFWINGKEFTLEEFHSHPDCTAWPKLTVDHAGNRIWRNKHGLYHKIDGPAIEHANGDTLWYQNSRLHRTDGPAIEEVNNNGYKEWWIKSIKLTEEEFYAHPACTIKQDNS